MKFLTSSIGKKIQMALTGLLLCGFLLSHLAGNLFLFQGQEAYNHYATVLASNPLIPLAEVGLVVLFLLHLTMALWTRLQNSKARPEKYAAYRSSGGRTWGSATMIFSGTLILVFLGIHLQSFRLQPDRRDLYTMVLKSFQNPLYAWFYILSMIGLGLHLSHGFQGGFQTLGISHPKYTPWIKKMGWAFAGLIALGFASMPVALGLLRCLRCR